MSGVEPSSPTIRRTFKVSIVGDNAVGKTCLKSVFGGEKFPEHTQPTIGFEFITRSFVVRNEVLKVQVWDTPGLKTYHPGLFNHLRSMDATIFVYDVTRRDTLQNLDKNRILYWEEEGNAAPRILIGNKCDVECSDRVSKDEAQTFANDNIMELFEISAKLESEGNRVESIFLGLLHNLQDKARSADPRGKRRVRF